MTISMRKKIPFGKVKNFISKFESEGHPEYILGQEFVSEFREYFRNEGRGLTPCDMGSLTKRIIYTECAELSL